MFATISDGIYIPKSIFKPSDLSDLCNLFTYTNPDYISNQRLHVSNANTPKTVETYINIDRDTIMFPRGSSSKLTQFCKNRNYSFRIIDNFIKHSDINFKFNRNFS